MAEDVMPEVIKGTQDILGRFIKRPVLTEKLLKKPPFRFLHDICTSVMKETGFFAGVLDSEDKMENIKNKENKLAFLQKVIGAVEKANNVKLSVKPTKIVAGLEATKTNELLQALGKALVKQQAENKHIKSQEFKAKNIKGHGKDTKEEHQDKKQISNKTSKRIIENGVNDLGDDNKKTSVNRMSISPTKKQSNKKYSETTPREEDKKLADKKPREKAVKNSDSAEDTTASFQNLTERKTDKILLEPNNANGAGERVDLKNSDAIKFNGTYGQGDHIIETKENARDCEISRGNSGKQKPRRSSSRTMTETTKAAFTANETNETENTKNQNLEINIQNKGNDSVNLIAKNENNTQEQTISAPSPPGQINYSKKETSIQREGTLISRPRTGIRPTTARPASARPPAPRIRDRGEVAAADEVTKPTSGKINVIVDRDANNELDEDNLISLEVTNDILIEEIATIPQSVTTDVEQSEHGHLVEQILEAQRELEDDAEILKERTSGKTEIEWQSGKNTESTNREIEKLKTNIQTLTRSANPLGKLLDFFQEDIDTIQRELESWKNKNSTLCIQIAHEKSVTEQYIEPLKIHLKEIQQSIDEESEKISLIKANIIRNNEKIHKLLVGI